MSLKRSIPLILLVSLIVLTAGTAMSATRPIWLYGFPTWMGEWSADEPMMKTANQWASAKFGATFRISGLPSGSNVIQALNLITAQGQFPDVITTSGSGGDDYRKLMVDLAKAGKIIPVDKYFNDPKNYPNLAKADKTSLRAFKYQGKTYAFPAWNWRVQETDPSWIGQMWIIRDDILDKLGGEPKTPEQLLAFLRKVKQGNFTDAQGNPVIPLGINPDARVGPVTQLIDSLRGAGWEVDGKNRLMPKWASQENYEAMKFVNQLVREGLTSPGVFTLTGDKWQDDLAQGRYAVAVGGTWIISMMRDTSIMGNANRLGKDDPLVKKYVGMQYVMLVNPVAEPDGSLGRLTNAQPGLTMISADNPNPDAVAKLIDFLISEEGLITYFQDAGYLGVDWEFTAKPLYWQVKGQPGSQQVPAERSALGARWRVDAPRVLPHVYYMASPIYSSYKERIGYQQLQRYKQVGQKIGDGPDGRTVLEWGLKHASALNRVVSPVPSYAFVTGVLPPREVSALASAQEKWESGLAKVLSAKTLNDFENQYESFLDSLIRVTNWKPIYEDRQQRWMDWMKQAGVDDRDELRTVTPRPEWKKVMGW